MKTSNGSQATQGLTPPEYLNRNEIVLYETQPHLVAVVGLRRIVWLFVGTLLFLPFVFAAGKYAYVVVLLWAALVLLPPLIPFLRWRHIFLTLTDQRIIMGEGAFARSFNALLDLGTYKITDVHFSQGVVGRMFGFGTIVFGTNHNDITWYGVKDPTTARRTIEEKIATIHHVSTDEAVYRQAAIKRVAEVRTEAEFGLIHPTSDGPMLARSEGPLLMVPRSANSGGNPETRYCSSCGTPNAVAASYCSKCGKGLPRT